MSRFKSSLFQSSLLSLLLAAGLLGALGAGSARAGTDYTWSGPANGDWFDGTKWNPNGVPGAGLGDTASVTNGSILLTNSTGPLASFTITNATLTFTNWTTALNATTVHVRSGGTLTHSLCYYLAPASSNRVYIVATDVTVDTGGAINVQGRGYADTGPGYYQSLNGRWGGGYGGVGGFAEGTPPPRYGSALTPTDPGSRGYYVGPAEQNYGGGAVRIMATGNVLVNGSIVANGNDCGAYRGAGSGGSVYIDCNTFSGTNGAVTAKGGTGPAEYVAGGGGGRIAVYYSATAQGSLSKPTVRFDANFGLSPHYYLNGTMGTVVFSDGQLLPSSYANWSGYLFPWGATNVLSLGNTTIDGNSIGFGNDWQLQNAGADLVLNVSGNLTLTNSAKVYLYSGLKNNPSVTNCGLLVNVSGDMTLATKCWIYAYSHLTNGATPYFRLGGNVTIATNAGINADAGGYQGSIAAGMYAGPGGGVYGHRIGGGYGGLGQNYNAGGSGGGGTYGSAILPTDPGSGGSSQGPFNGGGAVRIEARNVTMNGIISANGQNVIGTLLNGYCGAGSGGGIYIRCKNFSGNAAAIIRANGGNANTDPAVDGKGGGGGRIALWRVSDTFLGTVIATNGVGTSVLPLATTGTVVRVDIPPSGTVVTIR